MNLNKFTSTVIDVDERVIYEQNNGPYKILVTGFPSFNLTGTIETEDFKIAEPQHNNDIVKEFDEKS